MPARADATGVPGTSRRKSSSMEFGVTTNCAPNEPVVLNGYEFTFDACAIKGKRPYMEDRWCAVLDEDVGAFVLAVYDGHGGSAVSSHLSRHLAREILGEDTLRTDTEGALKRAFKRVDDQVCLDNPGNMRGMFGTPGAGSTAIMAVIIPPKMYVANLGDSRATTYDNRGSVTFESADQRPDVHAEKERIVKEGGFVKRGRDGTWRTGGILAVSRAFGNAGIKKFLSVEPEVSVIELDVVDSMILCSDGLTDVMDSKTASETMRAAPVGAMSSSPSPVRTRRVANSLVTLARVRQSRDNISVVVLQSRRLNGALAFPSLETPLSLTKTACRTPTTVQYDPAASAQEEPNEHSVSVSLVVKSGNIRVVCDARATKMSSRGTRFEASDGLSTPIPNVDRESTQAITPIGLVQAEAV